ncbi:MAG: trigger factor [bacterium]|nr:trigger factor [bacterium]
MIEKYTTAIKKLSGPGMHEITVEVAPPDVETCFQKALRRLAQTLEIEGFRKGKIPPAMAEKYIRTDALFNEAAHIAIENTYPDVVKHHQIEAIGKPEIEVVKIARGDSLQYKVRVAALGDVKLPDWKKTRMHRKEIAMTEPELEKALEYLQKSRVRYVASTHPARKGDFAEIDFTIRLGGVIIEGGSAQKHPFVLGEGRFIPGFEEQIEGMNVSEEKTFLLTFPDSYHEKAYAGREVACTVKLISLLDRIIPQRDDAFAQSLGDFKTFEELKKSVEGGIRREKEEHETSRVRLEAISEIARNAKMEIPDVLIEREIEKMFQDLEERVGGMSLSFEAYLDHLKKSRKELEADWRPEAQKRVRIALALRAIAKSERLVIPAEKVEERVQEIMKNRSSEKEAKKRYDKEVLREYAESVLMNEEVFNLLEKECIIETNV